MSLRFLDDPSRYKVPRVLYLVRWIDSKDHIAKKPYLRKNAAVKYWERRIRYTDSPCWIETFELTPTRENFYGQKIAETYTEATR
jgi:hypothetical protein